MTSSLVHSSLETLLIKAPLILSGTVVKGFGRGGKLLGCPTANVGIEKSGVKLEEIDNGIYFGWARLKSGVFKMVTSIGWNPQFENEKKTIEPHIMHKFEDDFYGEPISLVVFGYLRPEQKYESLDDLIEDIQNDIKVAEEALNEPTYLEYKDLLPEFNQVPTDLENVVDNNPTVDATADHKQELAETGAGSTASNEQQDAETSK